MVALFRVGFFPLPRLVARLAPRGLGFSLFACAEGLEPGYIRLPFAFAPMDRIVLDFIWLKLVVLKARHAKG